MADSKKIYVFSRSLTIRQHFNRFRISSRETGPMKLAMKLDETLKPQAQNQVKRNVLEGFEFHRTRDETQTSHPGVGPYDHDRSTDRRNDPSITRSSDEPGPASGKEGQQQIIYIFQWIHNVFQCFGGSGGARKATGKEFDRNDSFSILLSNSFLGVLYCIMTYAWRCRTSPRLNMRSPVPFQQAIRRDRIPDRY